MARTPNRRILAAAYALLTILTGACGKISSNSPTAPSGPPAPGSTIVYTAVGASDATGHGATVECFPFADCTNGTGYVPVTARQLRAEGFTVDLRNLGIPTAVIGRDFETLGQQYDRTIVGNFIDQEMPFVLQNSTVVTIFAGGNDVNTITAALRGGAGGGDQAAFVDAQVRAFGADYGTLLSGIRSRAPAVRIIVLNLPNLGSLPYLAGASAQQRQAAQRASVGMTTTVINPLTAQNVTVIDMMCDSRTYERSNYFSDGFHPNDAGYAFMAGEVVRAITTSSYPAPRASCSQMSAVP
jgi:lysophospholipase L1-like esterase